MRRMIYGIGKPALWGEGLWLGEEFGIWSFRQSCILSNGFFIAAASAHLCYTPMC